MTTANLTIHETLTKLLEELDERFACQSSKVDHRRQISCLSPDGGTRFTWILAAGQCPNWAYVRVENLRSQIPTFNFAIDFAYRCIIVKAYGFESQIIYECLDREQDLPEAGLVEIALLGNGTALLVEASVQHQPLCVLLSHASSALLSTAVKQRETMAAYREQNIITACLHQQQLEAQLPNPDTQSVNT